MEYQPTTSLESPVSEESPTPIMGTPSSDLPLSNGNNPSPKKLSIVWKLVIGILIIFLLGGVIIIASGIFGYVIFQQKAVTEAETISMDATNEKDTLPSVSDGVTKTLVFPDDWITYKSPNGRYTFKYPSNVYPVAATESAKFYTSKEEATKTEDCITHKLGTAKTPCGTGLFEVSFINSGDPAFYPIDDFSKPEFSSQVFRYQDKENNRIWILFGPRYSLGGTQSDAVLEDNPAFEVSIHIWDTYMDGKDSGKITEQLTFIHQILSTFVLFPEK